MSNETTVVYEEDIEAACKVAKRILGPVGRQVYPYNKKTTYINAKVGIPSYGILWYGDLEKHGTDEKLSRLCKELSLEAVILSSET